MSEAGRQRSAVLFGAATAERSTVFLLRRLAAVDVPRGRDHGVRPPGRFFQPALGQSYARSREAPIGLPREPNGHRGRRSCPACVVPFATARRSGFRILLAAWCPDSERGGRTNPGRCPVAPPSSR